MKALSINSTSEANRSASVTGTIPPGLTLLAFRNAPRQQPRSQPVEVTDAETASGFEGSYGHAAIAGLIAAATLLLLAFA